MSKEAVEESLQPEQAAAQIGEKLRSAREAKSMSLVEVARRLNLETEVVEGLENNSYESLPETAYVRGYLLAYLRLMELPTSLLKPFDDANKGNEPLITGNRISRSACSQDGWVKCISTGLVILLVIAVVLWFAEQSFNVFEFEPDEPMITDKPPATPQPVVETTDVSGPVNVFSMENELSQPASREQDAGADTVTAGSAGPESAIDPPSIVTAGDAAPEPQAEPQQTYTPVLNMQFSDETWIRIDDDQGNRLQAGTFLKGQDIRLEHQGPLHLIIGRTQHVKLDYAGEPVDLSAYRKGKVARLVLGGTSEQQ